MRHREASCFHMCFGCLKPVLSPIGATFGERSLMRAKTTGQCISEVPLERKWVCWSQRGTDLYCLAKLRIFSAFCRLCLDHIETK